MDERGKRKKKALYSFVIEGEKCVCPDEVCAKMFAAFPAERFLIRLIRVSFLPTILQLGKAA